MGNLNSRLFSQMEASARTALALSLIETMHQNLFMGIGPFLGLIKKLCSPLVKLLIQKF